MIVNCENVNKLHYANKLKLVAGRGGLDRVIKWVHYMENPGYIRWLKGGELVLITGIIIKDNINDLVKLVKNLNDRNAAGLVINIGPYIKNTPKEVINIANSLNFPIFELPFEVRFIDISQSICKAIFISKIEQESMNNFMKNIIYGNLKCEEKVVNRAVFYGYDPNKLYCTLIVNICNFSKFAMNDGVWDEEIAFRFIQQISQIMINVIGKYNRNIIHIVDNNSIIILLPVNKAEKDEVDLIGKDIIKNVYKRIKNVKINIGIGGFWTKLDDLKYSVDKAWKALKILKVMKNKYRVCNYNHMGIYKLLFEIRNSEEMKVFYNDILGKLINYDNKNSTKLVETLQVYIDQNCNMIKTSSLLFIHKNTLKYRIKRIEEICSCSFKNINDLLNFDIALKIKNFMICT